MKPFVAHHILRPATLAFLLLTLANLTPPAVGAQSSALDTVVLRTGGRVAGRIVESSPPNFVVIARSTGAQETLMWADILRVVRLTAGTTPAAPAVSAPVATPKSAVVAVSGGEGARPFAAPADTATPSTSPPGRSTASAASGSGTGADVLSPSGFLMFNYASSGQYGYSTTVAKYVGIRASSSSLSGLVGSPCGFGCSDVGSNDRNPRDARVDVNMITIGPVIPLSRRVLAFGEIGLQQSVLSAQFDSGRRSYGGVYGATFGGGVHLMASPRMMVSAGYSTGDLFFAGVGWR